MKKRLLFTLLCLLATINLFAQVQSPVNFNFDFEKVNNKKPVQWANFGGNAYRWGLDSQVVHTGRYAAFLEYNPDKAVDFHALGFTIPGSYDGRQIILTGFVKTEGVTDGHAGLWMRIDPNVAFDNMSGRGAVGTTDWTKYEVKLNLRPEETKQIVVGGILIGKGKMWVDNLTVTIDGKEIQGLEVIPAKIYPAEQDKTFDKGSGISEFVLNSDNLKMLKDLGLIWGFLKYYHPAVAAGNFNWDYELFRILPKVLNEKTQAKRDGILLNWINGLGEIMPQAAPLEFQKEVKMYPDLDWITHSGFSKELSAALQRVKNAQRTGEHYYLDFYPNVGAPKFKNENKYAAMKYPDAGYRLLALYRYWNMIQYFFPYRNLIEEDWKGVLGEFIPHFINAGNETEYLLAALEVIGRIQDTHANLWANSMALHKYWGEFFAAPAITFVEGKAVVTSFYNDTLGHETGLKIGDVILSVNGKKVDELVKERLHLSPASNYSTKLRNISRDLLRTQDSLLHLVYDRNGSLEKQIIRSYSTKEINPYNLPRPDSCFKVLDGNIAYLYPALLKRGEIETLWERFKSTQGLIIDLRCYPSDFIVFSLGAKLLPSKFPFVKFTNGNLFSPGLFTMTDCVEVGFRKNPDYYKGKVVILINEHTQSQAEYTTMALRIAPNATVIGSTTAGADGNVTEIILPGGLNTYISGIGVYYPDGRETQRVGIVPDIELKPTIRGIREGRDELLESAIELILRTK